jgi:FKBP-type peptidyl-prolyl cis-trans isomerase 2
MSYTIKITNVSDNDTTKQQTFTVTMNTGTCKPSTDKVPSVGKDMTLTVEPDDATGTLSFSYGAHIPVKRIMDAKKYPDGEDTLWVNMNPPGEKEAEVKSGDENNVKVTRP